MMTICVCIFFGILIGFVLAFILIANRTIDVLGAKLYNLHRELNNLVHKYEERERCVKKVKLDGRYERGYINGVKESMVYIDDHFKGFLNAEEDD